MEERETGSLEETSTPETGQVDEQVSENDSAPSPEQSGDVPSNEGQTSHLQDMATKFGWSEAEAPEQVAKMAANLEKKLGNWSDVEAKANLYNEIAPTLEKLQTPSQNNPQEQEPDWSKMSPEDIVDYRAKKQAEEMVKPLQEQFQSLHQDITNQKVQRAIQNVSSKYSDFQEYQPAIKEYIEQHPERIVDNEQALEEVYKIVTYDKAIQKGAEQAIEKQKIKKEQFLGSSGSSASTTKKAPSSIAEAFRQAEESFENN